MTDDHNETNSVVTLTKLGVLSRNGERPLLKCRTRGWLQDSAEVAGVSETTKESGIQRGRNGL